MARMGAFFLVRAWSDEQKRLDPIQRTPWSKNCSMFIQFAATQWEPPAEICHLVLLQCLPLQRGMGKHEKIPWSNICDWKLFPLLINAAAYTATLYQKYQMEETGILSNCQWTKITLNHIFFQPSSKLLHFSPNWLASSKPQGFLKEVLKQNLN